MEFSYFPPVTDCEYFQFTHRALVEYPVNGNWIKTCTECRRKCTKTGLQKKFHHPFIEASRRQGKIPETPLSEWPCCYVCVFRRVAKPDQSRLSPRPRCFFRPSEGSGNFLAFRPLRVRPGAGKLSEPVDVGVLRLAETVPASGM